MNLQELMEQMNEKAAVAADSVKQAAKNLPPYKDFKNYEREINAYRNKIQPMTDEQGNNFRHMAAAAAFSQKYNPIYTNAFGLAKEAKDYFIDNKSGLDSLGDIRNNFYGSLIGNKYKDVDRKTLYDLIYHSDTQYRK